VITWLPDKLSGWYERWEVSASNYTYDAETDTHRWNLEFDLVTYKKNTQLANQFDNLLMGW
jgi:hypothetical protein